MCDGRKDPLQILHCFLGDEWCWSNTATEGSVSLSSWVHHRRGFILFFSPPWARSCLVWCRFKFYFWAKTEKCRKGNHTPFLKINRRKDTARKIFCDACTLAWTTSRSSVCLTGSCLFLCMLLFRRAWSSFWGWGSRITHFCIKCHQLILVQYHLEEGVETKLSTWPTWENLLLRLRGRGKGKDLSILATHLSSKLLLFLLAWWGRCISWLF